MKIKVICQTCGRNLTIVEKDQVNQQDLDMYKAMSGCDLDDTFIPSLDGDGNPILDVNGAPVMIRVSNIISIKTDN